VVTDAYTTFLCSFYFQLKDRSETNKYFNYITCNKISLKTETQQQFIVYAV